MSTRKGVVGIIYFKNGGETVFLVLHRVLNWKGWEFPKGGIEKKDMAEEIGLKREILEETGLTNIRVLNKLPVEIKYKYPKTFSTKYKYTETSQAVFVVRAFQQDVKTTIEHDGFKWLKYEDARKTLTHDQQKKALDVAWKQIQGKLTGEEGMVTF